MTEVGSEPTPRRDFSLTFIFFLIVVDNLVDRWLLQDVNDENNDGNDQATRGNDVPNLRDLLHAQDGLETLIGNNGRIHIEVTQEECITFMERINSTTAGFSGREREKARRKKTLLSLKNFL